MNFIFAIYADGIYRELHLPVLNNSDYELVLHAGEFELEKDIRLQLEVVDETWRFRRSSAYQIFAGGQNFEGEPLKQGQILQLITGTKEHLVVLVWAASQELRAWMKFSVENTDRITIGSRPDNDICCPSMEIISGHHAELRFGSGGATVRDLSINGTYLGNRRVQGEGKLYFGDLINLYGLSILYLGQFLAVSSLDGKAQFREEHLRSLEEITISDKTQRMRRPASAETVVHISPRVIPELYDEPEVIEQIPPRREQDKKPAWMSILPSATMVIPMVLGFGMMGNGMGMGIVISVGSAVVGCTWACINLCYTRKTLREQELLRLTRYEEYLVQCADRIRDKFEHNQKALLEMYPDASTCAEYRADTPELWARRQNNSDFLFIRTGLGEMPFQVKISTPKAGFALVPDELAQRPERIAANYQTLKGVPLGVALGKYSVMGVLSREGEMQTVSLARSLITQLAATHCYTDVKLALLFDGNREHPEKWDFVRWLPHVWNEARSMRYIASSREEASDVLYALAQVLRNRAEQRGASYGGKTRFLPHYVLFVERPELLAGQVICKYLYENGVELGITTVILAREYEELPSACGFVIEDSYAFSGMYSVEESGAKRQATVFDRLPLSAAERMARRFSSLRVGEMEYSSDIPNSLTFFEMMGVHRLEELNAAEHWRKNRTYDSMRALIGQKAGGADCFLDIHEKYHGPHGLVAGTTGSGKSETLQTYILSLAVNFSPRDVGFFIIDFKGGGMANLFSNLPHMMGQISNLSGNQVRRAMVSIKSENNRRQRIFGEFGVNHIDAYTRLVKNKEASVPIPHLLIIIDEFAELKREQPEFMRELISVAQVGRSLGVHLILATQKPSGTVDDNIWSNTRFKLCLRVADKHDSNDMLHKPDAAYLTQAGRCYLQVGNDEIYELFQSGWSGAAYDPSGNMQKNGALMIDLQGREVRAGGGNLGERKEKAQRDWIAEIVTQIRKALEKQNISLPDGLRQGEREILARAVAAGLNQQEERYPASAFNLRRLEELLEIFPKNSEALLPEQLAQVLISNAADRGMKLPEQRVKTQLEAVVDYLAKTAEATELWNHQQLWMPVLPEELYLEQLDGYQESIFRDGIWPEHVGAFRLGVLMGLVDAPENQIQFPLNVDLAQNGHLALVGGVTSGKSTFLQTLFFSLISSYSPAEVNLYGIDFSSQMLCPFVGDAHVGGIVLEGEDDRLNKLFGLLGGMLHQRKKQIRGGSFRQYIQTNGPVLPAVVLVIDGYANFREKTENRFEGALMELSRDAEGYGIYLVISCGSFGGTELQTKIAEKMRQSISLEQSDRFRYNEVLHLSHIDVLPETNVKGRGLSVLEGSVLEFQTALACRAENDYKRSEEIVRRCREMSLCWTGRRATAIPEIPGRPTWELFSGLEDYRIAVQSGDRLPVAYCQETAAFYSVELSVTWCYLVLGREQTGKSVFLRNLACAANDIPDSKLYLIDAPDGGEELTAECSDAQYAKTPQELFQVVKELILLTNERGAYRKELQQKGLENEEIFAAMKKKYPPVFFFIANLREFMKTIYTKQEGIGQLSSWLETIFAKGQLLNVYFFAAANCNDMAQMDVFAAYQSFAREKHGVLLGGELNRQNHFAYQNIRFSDQSRLLKPGMGYAASQEGEQTVELIVIPQNRGKR